MIMIISLIVQTKNRFLQLYVHLYEYLYLGNQSLTCTTILNYMYIVYQ